MSPFDVGAAQAGQATGSPVGHSTGGGEVVHYLGRHGESRVAKVAILSAVPPLMAGLSTSPKCAESPERTKWTDPGGEP